MTAYTPGPWHCQVRKEGWDIHEPISAGGFKIAHANTEPNARLIAAAPQLLEALHNIVANVDDEAIQIVYTGRDGFNLVGTVANLDAARAAITAAGEQP